MYIKDDNLDKLLKNKKISYVGPSAHLINTNSGEHIDSYDLVARVNQDFPIPPNRVKDYGKRTDILVACFSRVFTKLIKPYFDNNSDYIKNLKYIICPWYDHENTPSNPFTPRPRDLNLEESFQKLNKFNTPYYGLGDEFTADMHRGMNCETCSGLAGIIILLKYDIREIYVTGISFFNMGASETFEELHYSEYADSREKVGIGRKIRYGHEFGHYQPPQINYFKKMMKQDNRIKLDDYLKEKLTS